MKNKKLITAICLFVIVATIIFALAKISDDISNWFSQPVTALKIWHVAIALIVTKILFK